MGHIRIVITFADGQVSHCAMNAEAGAFNFRVQADCPAITNVWVSAPNAAVEPFHPSEEDVT